jgi:hypothetical protein
MWDTNFFSDIISVISCIFIQVKSFSLSNENVLRSVAASWYVNQTKALTGQEKEFGKNARIFIDREQPLIPVNLVTFYRGVN